MRCVSLLLLASCAFQIEPSPAAIDAPQEAPDADALVPITWTVDATSGIACPASTSEWLDFIAAKNLPLAAPDGLWLMQEASGPLDDATGTVDLAPFGAPAWSQPVVGWTRRAAATPPNTTSGFRHTNPATLPDVSTGSLLVLAFYQSGATAAGPRSLLFGGGGTSASLGEVSIDATDRLRFTVGGTSAMGTHVHGREVFPLVMKMDVTNQQQKVITPFETIQQAYRALSSSKGLILGGANLQAPDSRWLYMAAWYSARAEITDADLKTLLTALGW